MRILCLCDWPIPAGYRWLWSFLPPNDDEVDFCCPRAAPADRARKWGKLLGYYPAHMGLAARALARTKRTEYDAVLAFEAKCGLPYALVRTMDHRPWTMVPRSETVGQGRQKMDRGPRTMDHGRRTLRFAQGRLMDHDGRTMDPSLRSGQAHGRGPRLVILFFSVKGIVTHFLWAARWGMGAVDRILVPARREVEYYARLLGYPRERISLCPVGVHDPGVYGRQPAGETGYVLAGGRSDRDYGTFFEAVSGLACRAVVRTRPWAISGLGAPPNVQVQDMDDPALAQALAGAACVVVPLREVRHAAGLSLIVLGMAAGRPVIATRSGGAEDYVTHGENGLLVEPGDAAGLREAIRYVLEHPDEAARMGTEGRARYVLQHRFEQMAERVRRALVEVCADGGFRV